MYEKIGDAWQVVVDPMNLSAKTGEKKFKIVLEKDDAIDTKGLKIFKEDFLVSSAFLEIDENSYRPNKDKPTEIIFSVDPKWSDEDIFVATQNRLQINFCCKVEN